MNTNTNEDQKNEVRDKVATAAAKGAKHAATAAKKATGWKKWALILLAVAASAVALFMQQSCKQVQSFTPAQLQQVKQVGHAAHAGFHAVTGRPCAFILPVEPGDK